MAEFTLPKNSKVQKGRHFPAPAGAGKCLPFWTLEFFGRVNSAIASLLQYLRSFGGITLTSLVSTLRCTGR